MTIDERIIELWRQRTPAEEIADELKVPTFQVQHVIDSVVNNASVDWWDNSKKEDEV